jgi:hypothetical protein
MKPGQLSRPRPAFADAVAVEQTIRGSLSHCWFQVKKSLYSSFVCCKATIQQSVRAGTHDMKAVLDLCAYAGSGLLRVLLVAINALS